MAAGQPLIDETPVDVHSFEITIPTGHLFGDWIRARMELEDIGIASIVFAVRHLRCAARSLGRELCRHRHIPAAAQGRWHGRAYGLYAAAAAIPLPFVWLAVHETKGKTLEEMSSG